MTRDGALALAQEEAVKKSHPVDLYEHTGKPSVPPQHRWIIRMTGVPPPKHGVWTKRETIEPPVPIDILEAEAVAAAQREEAEAEAAVEAARQKLASVKRKASKKASTKKATKKKATTKKTR